MNKQCCEKCIEYDDTGSQNRCCNSSCPCHTQESKEELSKCCGAIKDEAVITKGKYYCSNCRKGFEPQEPMEEISNEDYKCGGCGKCEACLITPQEPIEWEKRAYEFLDRFGNARYEGVEGLKGESEDDILKEFIQFLKSQIKQAEERGYVKGQEEYKQFVLNILDGVDKADKEMGFASTTRSIRFALSSRVINQNNED